MKQAAVNVSGLPTGVEFVSKKGYSDMEPYAIVRKSASGATIYVKPVEVELDPAFKPEFQVGGFAAHCSNQSAQKWVFKRICEELKEIPIKVASKKAAADWRDGARKFYDYNF